ncbi:MAG: peptidoglycan-associated lipoprotein Pal [Acidobacteria bacterium]|nr:peptidoglycan-associated lipoprotein Pal [Acidobacteriota bacterium]
MIKPSVCTSLLALGLLVLMAGGCAKKTPPVARPMPPPSRPGGIPARPPAPPEPVLEQPVIPPEPVAEESIGSKSLDDLNRDSPLKAVFFDYDSAELAADAQAALTSNAQVLKTYATWVVTIEGHCDERGTAEYNLALGERRAIAARGYLVSLGIPGDRLRTISYGKEFPFDSGHDESAWRKNRRAHFVITAK